MTPETRKMLESTVQTWLENYLKFFETAQILKKSEISDSKMRKLQSTEQYLKLSLDILEKAIESF